MSAYLLLWLLAGAVVFQSLHLLYRIAFSPLRSIPGPFFARFRDGWYFWLLYRGHFNLDNRELHSKYGRSYPNSPFPPPTY